MHRPIRIRATTRERQSRRWRTYSIRPAAPRHCQRNGSCSSCPNGCLLRDGFVPERILRLLRAKRPCCSCGRQMAAARMDAAARARREPANRGIARLIARTARNASAGRNRDFSGLASTGSFFAELFAARLFPAGPAVFCLGRRWSNTPDALDIASVKLRPGPEGLGTTGDRDNELESPFYELTQRVSEIDPTDPAG